MLSWSTCSWCKHLDASNGHGLIVSSCGVIQSNQVKKVHQHSTENGHVSQEEFLWLFYSDIQLFPEFTTVELVLKSTWDLRPSRGIVVQIMIFIHVTHLLTLQKRKISDIYIYNICLSPSAILVRISVRYMTANCHQIWNCMTISLYMYIYIYKCGTLI